MTTIIPRYALAMILLMVLSLTGIRCKAQDKIETFAHGIAMTEGFYIKRTIPNRYHNPGDLKIMARGEKYPGQVGVGKADHVIFRNSAAGYSALYHQIDKMISGESKFYTQEMTLLQVGKLYAKNSRLWAKNLAKNLGVKPSTTLEEYFELPPRVVIKVQGGPNL
jgi:hypothetical protein